MEKTPDGKGVLITKEVVEVVNLTDLDLELERLEGQRYEQEIRITEKQAILTQIEDKIELKKKLRADMLTAFPELES